MSDAAALNEAHGIAGEVEQAMWPHAAELTLAVALGTEYAVEAL